MDFVDVKIAEKELQFYCEKSVRKYLWEEMRLFI